MNFEVFVLAQAERELQVIAAWIAERSLDGALRWLDAFESAKRSVAKNPYAYGLAIENEYVDYEVRQVQFGTRQGNRYRAVFTVAENEVRILHIRGPGQPPLSAEDVG